MDIRALMPNHDQQSTSDKNAKTEESYEASTTAATTKAISTTTANTTTTTASRGQSGHTAEISTHKHSMPYLSLDDRRRLLVMILWQFVVSCFSFNSVEVAASLILETQYGWSTEQLGFGIGSVLAATSLVALVLIGFRELGQLTDRWLLGSLAILVGLGGALLVDFGDLSQDPEAKSGAWLLLTGDLLLYPGIVCMTSMTEGFAYTLAIPGSRVFAPESIVVATAWLEAATRLITTPTTRLVIAVFGRNVYAALQLAAVFFCTWTASDVLRAIERGTTTNTVKSQLNEKAALAGDQGLPALEAALGKNI